MGAGAELTDVYGIDSNQETLWKWGFTIPWIHNLTCLSWTRLKLNVEDLPGLGLPRPGFGAVAAQPRLIEMLPPFIQFRAGSCLGSKRKQSRAMPDGGLGELLAFMRAWLAAARAGTPGELQEHCGFCAPAPLRALLQPGLRPETCPETMRWSFTRRCSHLKAEDELRALRTAADAVQRRLVGLPGGTLEAEELLLAGVCLQSSQQDVAVLRRDEKYVLRKLEVWLSNKISKLKPGKGKRLQWNMVDEL